MRGGIESFAGIGDETRRVPTPAGVVAHPQQGRRGLRGRSPPIFEKIISWRGDLGAEILGTGTELRAVRGGTVRPNHILLGGLDPLRGDLADVAGIVVNQDASRGQGRTRC